MEFYRCKIIQYTSGTLTIIAEKPTIHRDNGENMDFNG